VKNKYFGLEKIYSIVCIIYVGLIFLYISTFFVERPQYGIVFWGMSIIVFVLSFIQGHFKFLNKFRKYKIISRFILPILIVLTIITAIYFFKEYPFLIYERAGSTNIIDILFGGIAIILTLIAVLGSSGPPIAIMSIIFLVYALFGRFTLGIFKFSGFSLHRTIDIVASEVLRGVFGSLLQIGGSIVAVFLIFAGLVFGLGGSDVITKISLIISKRSKYLVTQSAVLASAIMGMFSGSGSGNVAATGSFTIPLMKKYNVPAYFAGAIEAVASSGGQLMPPIMGASAFLMAEFLGVPYIKIAIMGALPAILYFMGVSFSVYHISRLVDIKVPSFGEKTSINKTNNRELLIDSIPLIVSIISLMIIMLYLQYGVLLAGRFVIIIFLITQFFVGLVKEYIRTKKVKIFYYVKNFLSNLVEGIKKASRIVTQIGLALSCVGIIISIISTSGLGIKMNMAFIRIGEGQIWLSLILGAIVCLMLGCIVSTVAVYVIAYVTVVPVLLRLGINPYIANFYVFWFAISGLITPPVAAAVVAASGIANSNFLRTAKESIKIGIGLLILPVSMILYPELIIHNYYSISSFLFIAVSLFALSVSFYGGYLFEKSHALLFRFFSFIIALILVFPFNILFLKIIIAVIYITMFYYIKTKKIKDV
jgi:TRAP transporter 4TM/12TM fusion protein